MFLNELNPLKRDCKGRDLIWGFQIYFYYKNKKKRRGRNRVSIKGYTIMIVSVFHDIHRSEEFASDGLVGGGEAVDEVHHLAAWLAFLRREQLPEWCRKGLIMNWLVAVEGSISDHRLLFSLNIHL